MQAADEKKHTASWAAAGNQQASHDTLVANWASTAAANLQQQHQTQTHSATDPSAMSPSNSVLHVPVNSTHTSEDINKMPIQDANVNISSSSFDRKKESAPEDMQVDQHIGTLKQITTDDYRPNNGGEIRHSQQHNQSEIPFDSPRSKLTQSHSNYQEREYQMRSNSSGDCQNNSPRQVLSEERSNRPGREHETSSNRGRSHTPASRSRSPHSGHNISASPDSRSGRNRNERTPTPINGYEGHAPARPQTDAPRLSSIGSTNIVSPKIQQPDSNVDGDILDDVSDISEGDIPDIPALSEDDTKEGQHTLQIDTASSEQVRLWHKLMLCFKAKSL